jgi:hypothetical protein
MYDDDVDFLLLGNKDQGGLIRWSGASSTKHDGQLKRIAASVIALLRLLLTLEPDDYGINIFFDRCMRIPVNSLLDINFSKHIAPDNSSSLMSGSSRSGSADDACEILSLIMQCHVTEDGEPENVDINYLLNDNARSRDLFMAWLQESAREEVTSRSVHLIIHNMALYVNIYLHTSVPP